MKLLHTLFPLGLLWMAFPVSTHAVVLHPLDSLQASEYEATMAILTANGRVAEDTRIPRISLLEPDKAFVKSWNSGDDIPRQVIAIVKEGPVSYKAQVDLVAETVVSFEVAEGEDMFLLEEVLSAVDLVVASPEMVEGLSKRGVSPDEIYCLPLSAGSFGDPIEEGRRLMRVPCYQLPTGSNWYAHPIEGLFALVDLNSKTVLEVTDTGVVPIQPDPWGYTAEEIEARYGVLRGPETVEGDQEAAGQSEVGYTLDGNVVTWDIFKFHFRVDKRPGLMLTNIEVNDKGTTREVLYEAYLSEVFVPYMDPSDGWYWRTYMDSGEYGFGVFMTPLTHGVDCPTTATYIGATFHDDFGMPFTIPDAICLFERSIGDPAWRHFEIYVQEDGFTPAEGRASTELVMRYAAEIGNYDYLVDYIFKQDGEIKIGVGSTGLDAVKGAATKTMSDSTAAADTMYGTLIAPGLVAADHSHFFNFRLDFDVDGEENSFFKGTLSLTNITSLGKPRTSLWTVNTEEVPSEIAARTKIQSSSPAYYWFRNSLKESGLGHNPSYQLLPGGSFAHSLLSMEDWPVRRNPYVENQLWVTPYDPDERYAGGEYAVQSSGNDTLYTWTEMDRSIVDTDIVAWYTVGFHHVPRMEDWPVMPTHWAYFTLRPYNFFTENPSIMLTPQSGIPMTKATEPSSMGISLDSSVTFMKTTAMTALVSLMVAMM